MSARRQRGQRIAPRGRLQIQARDAAVCQFIGWGGVTELESVALVGWGVGSGAPAAAARRLRKYTDHGLVATHVREFSAPNRYTLTETGASWFGGPGLDGRVLRTRVRPYSQSADHLVATSRVWAALAYRLSLPGAPRLHRFVTEAEVRRSLGNARGALIPDGIAITGRASFGCSIELDLNNERRAILAMKLQKYRRHLPTGAPLLGLPLGAVLVVASGVQRLARLAILGREAGLERAIYFQDLERLSPATVLDKVATFSSLANAATTGGDPFNRSLIEVCS